MAGGRGAGNYGLESLASTEILEGGVWREGQPLPSPRPGARAAVLQGKLLLTGGGAGHNVMDEVLSFNPDTEAWDTEGRLDTGKAGHAVTVLPYRDIQQYCAKGE